MPNAGARAAAPSTTTPVGSAVAAGAKLRGRAARHGRRAAVRRGAWCGLSRGGRRARSTGAPGVPRAAISAEQRGGAGRADQGCPAPTPRGSLHPAGSVRVWTLHPTCRLPARREPYKTLTPAPILTLTLTQIYTRARTGPPSPLTSPGLGTHCESLTCCLHARRSYTQLHPAVPATTLLCSRRDPTLTLTPTPQPLYGPHPDHASTTYQARRHALSTRN